MVKRTSKELMEEGITPDLLNAINMQISHSPVMLHPGDKPIKLLPCSNGFWVIDGSGILKDDKNKPVVFTEKECRIGRARYLLLHGKNEKTKKIKELIASWEASIELKMTKCREQIKTMENTYRKEEGMEHTMIHHLKGSNWDKFKEQKLVELIRMEADFAEIELMLKNRQIIHLLELFDIRKFPSGTNPMFSVQLEDEKGLRIMKNTFGGKALSKWDGDMTNRYATLEIEKLYPI